MQSYSGQSYLCPYYTCTSPYCIAIRPNGALSSSLTTNRTSSASATTTGSSFSISSILSRGSEENSSKADSKSEMPTSPTKTEGSVSSLATYGPSHFTALDRFHPYHRAIGVSAFTRAGSCGGLQKGERMSLLTL